MFGVAPSNWEHLWVKCCQSVQVLVFTFPHHHVGSAGAFKSRPTFSSRGPRGRAAEGWTTGCAATLRGRGGCTETKVSRWVIQFSPCCPCWGLRRHHWWSSDLWSSQFIGLAPVSQTARCLFTVCRRWRFHRQETNVYKDLLLLTAALLPLARREEENIALEKNEKADMKTCQTVEIDLTFKVNCLLFLFTLPRKVSMLPPIPSNILYQKNVIA